MIEPQGDKNGLFGYTTAKKQLPTENNSIFFICAKKHGKKYIVFAFKPLTQSRFYIILK